MTEPTDTPTPDDVDLAAVANPTAATAGQEDHTDPWKYAGEDTDPPAGAVPLEPEEGGS